MKCYDTNFGCTAFIIGFFKHIFTSLTSFTVFPELCKNIVKHFLPNKVLGSLEVYE
jgi:hypothetical protein